MCLNVLPLTFCFLQTCLDINCTNRFKQQFQRSGSFHFWMRCRQRPRRRCTLPLCLRAPVCVISLPLCSHFLREGFFSFWVHSWGLRLAGLSQRSLCLTPAPLFPPACFGQCSQERRRRSQPSLQTAPVRESAGSLCTVQSSAGGALLTRSLRRSHSRAAAAELRSCRV